MNTKEFYLSPKGRIPRQEFWLGLMLPAFCIGFLSGSLDVIFLGWSPRQSHLGVITNIVILVLVYPSIIVLVKRLHDHDKSGWWVLIYLIPIAGWIWQIVECGCLRGTVGDNRYGPDPLPPPYYTASPGAGTGRRDA